jgi:hypothetical protein
MNKLSLLLATALVLVSCRDVSTAPEVPGDANTIVRIWGDDQRGGISSLLPDSLVVAVLDRSGNPVRDVRVSFSVTSGGGNVSSGEVTTGADGQAAAHWTLGPEMGVQSVAATAQGLTGAPVHFTATAVGLHVASVAPDTLIPGATVTITGIGFDSTPGNNAVTIDHVPAIVTAATHTTLQITVPAEQCRPERTVAVRVTVGGVASNAAAAYARPTAFLDLAVGEQMILLDPARFCLQFAATVASEAYLIGVQSTGMDASILTPTRLIARVAGGTSLSSLPHSLTQSPRSFALPADPDLDAWHGDREAEREIRRFEERMLARLPANLRTGGSGVTGAGAVDSNVAVGDTLHSVRRRDPRGSSCNDFLALTTVVRAISTRSIWVEDVVGAGGYTTADYESMGAWMDDVIYDVVVSYFGEPGDRDGNGRIVIVVTPDIPDHVSICDTFSREEMAASNGGEFIWFRKPREGESSVLMQNLPRTLAHELTHVIQLARRGLEGRLDARWLWEGMAVLAEEVVGHAASGRAPGQNYGFDVAFNTAESSGPFWYLNKFTGLGQYFGFGPTRHAAAPHECTWIGSLFEGNDGPCGGSAVYFAPWSLFRWASDHFGPDYPGGEAALNRDITGHPAQGMANLSQLVGVSADTLLAQWAAALYVDDRVEGAHPRLTIPSWNLRDIFGSLGEQYRLTPTEARFSNSNIAKNVRDGSTAYFRVSGAGRRAIAIEARSDEGGALAPTMNLWIVRLQ